ncbi:hypothetical protein ColLi_07286 [Colletotrichum liriopes]|uniref:Uncharacterized protein n=1 Tax=Colletotrichum liriopes TaxID=708192 RepID=A0AA37LUG8_9PEZI|nr:hypothetical protein ColLi_07286 [Colletotrichum liriopes]
MGSRPSRVESSKGEAGYGETCPTQSIRRPAAGRKEIDGDNDGGDDDEDDEDGGDSDGDGDSGLKTTTQVRRAATIEDRVGKVRVGRGPSKAMFEEGSAQVWSQSLTTMGGA